jgi:hypothetical protein
MNAQPEYVKKLKLGVPLTDEDKSNFWYSQALKLMAALCKAWDEKEELEAQVHRLTAAEQLMQLYAMPVEEDQ